MAQGNPNLVVGDIKQSIYRWRGSDWRLMSEYLYRDLGRSAIHKAKGLSLDAVIIPFVDDPFTLPTLLQPTLWCETSGPFAELGLIPLKASKSLLDTCFASDYIRERIYEYVDVVNTWYVAFTRALRPEERSLHAGR